MVMFRRFNLLDSFGWLDDLDILFCRNVLIYFDRATRIDMLERMADTLASDGVLLLGESEGPESLIPAFTQGPEGRGIYARARTSVARYA
jgi:chemotaxis protein methyltransferase CheR